MTVRIHEAVFDNEPIDWWFGKCEEHVDKTTLAWQAVGAIVIYGFTFPAAVLYFLWEGFMTIYRIVHDM